MLRDNPEEVLGPNDVGAMDLVHGTAAKGSELLMPTIINTHPRFTHSGEDVVHRPELVIAQAGGLSAIQVDTGGDFISRDLDFRACAKDAPKTSHDLAGLPTTTSSTRSPESLGPNARMGIGSQASWTGQNTWRIGIVTTTRVDMIARSGIMP